jgi:hypothetical protein
MSSPMVTNMNELGLYYSRLEDKFSSPELMPAMRSIHKGGYAHFGSVGVLQVVRRIMEDNVEWSFCPSKEKYFILPKDLIVWQNP